jgi:hypothetical protein
VPEWHVSINDVPIGPIRLEEMAHKIDAGAVSEYSLVWRDGFSEWRPLATVPELMSALHERRHSGPPSRSSFSSMPPFVEARTSFSDPAPVAAVPSPPSSFPGVATVDTESDFAPLADVLQPEIPEVGLDQMSQPPAAIGPEAVFQSSPRLGSYSGLPPSPTDQVSVPSAPPEPAASTAEPKSRLSLGILALIVAVAVFSGVVAFLAFDRFGDDLMKKWVTEGETSRVEPPAPKKATTPVNAPDAVGAADVEPDPAAVAEAQTDGAPDPSDADVAEAVEAVEAAEVSEPTEGTSDAESAAGVALSTEKVDGEVAVVPPPDPRDNSAKIAPVAKAKPRATRRSRPKPVVEPEPKSDVSASEQKILDEYGSGANATPAKIDVQKSGSTQSKKPPLDGDGVRATVTTNKPRLQRCYERAIRGQQSPPSVRLDITVTVAPSGRVKNVTSEGSGPGGLAECVEASVRRWRFPDSAEGGPARFPIVFSAN